MHGNVFGCLFVCIHPLLHHRIICKTAIITQAARPQVVLCKPMAGSEGDASSVTAVAEKLSAFLRNGGVAEPRARPAATAESLRAQLLALAEALFEHGQLGLVPALVALAGPLRDDPVLQFLRV